MKSRLVIFILTSILLVIGINVQAQKQWTLEECIEYAFDNNIQIKQSVLNVNSADRDVTQSKYGLAPNLNATASHQYGWGRSYDQSANRYANNNTQQSYFSINSQVTLFNGFQLINNVRQKQFDYLAEKYNSDKIRNDMSLNVAAAYLQILFNIELAKNAERQVDISNEQIEKTKKQVDAGALAQGQLYDIEAQGASDEAVLVNSKNNVLLAYLDLMQLLDIESNVEFDVEKPILEITSTPTLLPAEMIYNKSVMIMPEIKSAEYRLESANKSLSIVKGMRSPRLYANGSYGTNYSDQLVKSFIPGQPGYDEKIPFGDQFKEHRNGTLSLGVSIPLFNGYQVSTNIKKSKIYLDVVNLELESEKLRLRKNIESAYADAIAAYQTFLSRNKSVDAFKESFKYTEEKFNVGMVNSTDYNVVKTQLANAVSDLTSSKFDYIFKVKILDFYLGKSLTLKDIANIK
ncbi:MAG: TolC family protein [Lentimicrobiaceae bacterium]|jgi:outer membrane protein|nr:TolC family protein [Lentimicrobiaceae bacterium]MCP4909457.1 TolC family protein [Bacteroidota bacterium]MBT3454123.1 TolC family protein [Lentimicrobiaceae bacterium]MBT3819343.1 TolC family protein [Lentimicrobiaceae bacterium]MBT4061016.1 TolC family protein [Lentimicrobiaceae bacterium]